MSSLILEPSEVKDLEEQMLNYNASLILTNKIRMEIHLVVIYRENIDLMQKGMRLSRDTM